MARPKKRTYESRIQKLIRKGEYKARPKGRPPKNSEWNYKTGQYEMKFDRALFKAANERLRKLEKVHKKVTAQNSEIYQLMQKYAVSYPKTKGKIYTMKDGKLRFINKSAFDKLSAEEKSYYIDRLNRFMESASSTQTGILSAHEKSYKEFMKNYGKNYPGLSQAQYEAFFTTYNYNVVGDSESHYSYSDWSKVLSNIRIDKAMTDKQMKKVMEYVRANKWNDLKKYKGGKYLLRI